MNRSPDTLITPDHHRVAYQCIGNPTALPLIFLHGGPGGRITNQQIRFIGRRRTKFYALFFDQRGCGMSTPHCDMTHNSTQHLLRDMEQLRTTAAIDRWLVVGGSWGSTLALAYAQHYPHRVLGLVLRSVFLGSRDEVRHAFATHAMRFRPELWHQLKERAQQRCQKSFSDDQLLAQWGDFIRDPHQADDRAAAWIWHDYERILSDLNSEQSLPSWQEAADRKDFPRSPFLEWHYMRHDFFLPSSWWQKDMPFHIPLRVVAARYDLLCPPATAHRLVQAWGDKAHITFAEESGHHGGHKNVQRALASILDTARRWI